MLYLTVVTFLFGLCIGSFLNVLIYRLPRGLNAAKGFSFCPACNHRLFALDLIPLFSWLFLRGKCRYCGARISAQYPVVELTNALLWTGCVWRFGFGGAAFAAMAVCSALLVVAFCDWQQREIPDSMHLVILAGALVSMLTGSGLSVGARLAGAVCVAAPMLVLALVTGGAAMGGGDIKLMAALGLFFGWKLSLFTLFGGALLGTAAFFVLAKTKAKLGREVPFGSFLSAAAVLAIFYGDSLLSWYFSLLGL